MDIQSLLDGVPLKKLSHAFQELSEGYRTRVGFTIDSEEKALAYLIYRSPATMGVLRHLLSEIPGEVRTICDCGAGSGASLWPLHDAFSVEHVTLIEENRRLISLGMRLGAPFHSQVWKQGDLRQLSFQEHDLFLFSYSLNEIKAEDAHLILRKAFQKTNKYLLIVEPGTPEGYQKILGYRDVLIGAGAFLIAPCPHMNACPMKEGNWCHFSERIERSREHRFLKGGSLGYEDEKYSYLLFSKEEAPPLGERILASPRKEKHAVFLTVCGASGIEEKCIPKSQKNNYKLAKKIHWGDTLPIL